ncbi:MAG: sigma-70 family RNA polymerase sigma factor [Flavobacteriales bacterium]|nr:sigma-70 family RNA polymerase sigma factor [Flavobacteriales bacterium]
MRIGRRKKDIGNQELLWQKFLDNDMSAFHRIYRENYQVLFSYAMRFYYDKSSAEDCLQTMFLNILNSRQKLPKVKNVKAYLMKSLRNQILNSKRTKIDDFPLIADSEFDFKKKGLNENVYGQLKELINKLSPRERELVYLKYFHGFRSTEISTLLDIEYQTVRNILANAITKMRKLGDNVLQLLFILFR